ncbi:MAG: AMP-binding protein, partial [Acidimicrobiia bacterium]
MSEVVLSVDRGTWWELIEARAARSPDRRLLIDDRGRSLTCVEFRDLAERVAAGLWDVGVRPGHVVSWQLPTTIEAPLLAAALSRLGVSQNPIISMLRRAEVGHIIEQLSSRWLVVPGVWRGFDHRALAEEVTCGRDCTIVVCDASGLGPGRWAVPQGDPSILPAFDPTAAEAGARCTFYTS